jgi:hypothetical protein
MWQALIGPVSEIAGTWLKGKQEKAQAKAKLEVAKIEATAKKVEQDGEWDAQAMNASDNSWKDEAWTICFILIILASFVPPLQPFMQAGFDFLRSAPDWLQWGILASIAASFGIKSISQLKK